MAATSQQHLQSRSFTSPPPPPYSNDNRTLCSVEAKNRFSTHTLALSLSPPVASVAAPLPWDGDALPLEGDLYHNHTDKDGDSHSLSVCWCSARTTNT